MTKLLAVVISLCPVLLLSSCVAQKRLHKLPTYDECMAIKPSGPTRYVWASETPVEELPALIPYAAIVTAGNDQYYCMKKSIDEGTKLGADLVYMGDTTSVYAGTVTSFSGNTAFSSNQYAIAMSTCCYRLSPVRLGFWFDEDGMVVAINAETRNSGLLEGDTVVSVAGSPVLKRDGFLRSPHYRKVIKMKPGDEVTVVWIRPGTGRMEGKVTCLPNPPTHLELPDADITSVPGYMRASQD